MNQKNEGCFDTEQLTMKMTEGDILKVQVWLDRIRVNADRAINLSDELRLDDLNEENSLFWALVKLAENVEESIIQLDKLNSDIFECLIEIPVKNTKDPTEKLTWTALKGMRNRLAHQFWNIEPRILWETVTDDFKKVSLLLHCLRVIKTPHIGSDDIYITISREEFENLPVSEESDPGPMKLGYTIAVLYFEEDRTPNGIRVGRPANDNALIAASSGRGGIYLNIRG